MDEYVTRTVTDLTYRRPPGSKAEDDVLPAKLLANQASQEALQDESFPIPLEEHQMNPRLLLDYACERIVMHG